MFLHLHYWKFANESDDLADKMDSSLSNILYFYLILIVGEDGAEEEVPEWEKELQQELQVI